jgi:hypothetical protein
MARVCRFDASGDGSPPACALASGIRSSSSMPSGRPAPSSLSAGRPTSPMRRPPRSPNSQFSTSSYREEPCSATWGSTEVTRVRRMPGGSPTEADAPSPRSVVAFGRPPSPTELQRGRRGSSISFRNDGNFGGDTAVGPSSRERTQRSSTDSERPADPDNPKLSERRYSSGSWCGTAWPPVATSAGGEALRQTCQPELRPIIR